MGGRSRSRTKRKHFRHPRDEGRKRLKSDSQKPPDRAPSVDDEANGDATNSNPITEPFSKHNLSFEEYYKEQGIVSPEEWDTFIEYLQTPLPVAFRINSRTQCYMDIRSMLEDDFMNSLQAEISDGSEVEAIKPLPWYPDNLAWHSNFSRSQLRKNQTLKRFHEFLKLQNEIGNITRQEAVSMVPPLFLDVRPDHFVLDMCAAPGSKTFQLLEMIYHEGVPGSLPTGVVIANDVDVQRCNLLIHQTKRICTANLIVTNHEAQHFPNCHLYRHHPNSSEIRSFEVPDITQHLFDRVLCDVPCSGDGTLRKAPGIWKKWNVGMANGLHGLQVQIAMRGISLLKVGGRMVYSTCSMNPIENEAVVSEVLHRCGQCVELLDVSIEIPHLIRRPGLKKWKVKDKEVWLNSYKDAPKPRRGSIVPGMFPSQCNWSFENVIHMDKEHTTSTSILEEEVSTLPLERCMRIVPHDQNTGAFFIAVFHKLSNLPGLHDKETDDPAYYNKSDKKYQDNEADDVHLCGNTSASPEMVGRTKLQIQGKWRGVDPVIFYRDNELTSKIKDFYGIKKSFSFDGNLVTRNSDTKNVKRIYYVSKSVKEVLELNLLAGQQLKIASVGLKMFVRQPYKDGASAPCVFRISSEGLPLLLPHITNQVLYASLLDFKHLLQYKIIKFADFVDSNFREKASTLLLGFCVVVLDNKDEQTAIGCWRGRTNISVMVSSLDCQELLERMDKYVKEDMVSSLHCNDQSFVKAEDQTRVAVVPNQMPKSLGALG
ncbi:unnamed protein product [Cuscuta epithymum]|uniref:SAM-dependent MTase RsmB/NOP-type domain-containing protein n=2 Tax=Cuscuta epithymum TaxID=186058 RepID=A0AAV0G5G9_9ASTE|nr:unnamed protein product [Cuscuta epithymum]